MGSPWRGPRTYTFYCFINESLVLLLNFKIFVFADDTLLVNTDDTYILVGHKKLANI